MMIYHDSRSNLYRNPVGAAECGSDVTLRIRATGIAKAQVRIWWDGKERLLPMDSSAGEMYECVLGLPEKTGLLWYFFRVTDTDGRVWYFGNAADKLGGVGQLTSSEPDSYQITVYRKDFKTPEWMRNGIMMQVMVDRFRTSGELKQENLPAGSFYHAAWDEDPVLICNDRKGDYANNDYFGGNLRGLIEKLDYLCEMGVTVLYLNPIFRARSNHKYNTANYKQIDPSFGTEDDFKDLCAEARERGIRVILDGVFSHTGSDSIYFNRNGTYGPGGAYNDPKSPYASWYLFKKWPDSYTSWWGFSTLPTLNKNDPSYRRYFVTGKDSVVAYWLNKGASGWRLDVADELPMDLLAQIRRREKTVNPDSALIGEVWEDPSNKVAYGELRCYAAGDTLDSTMNYPLREAILLFLRCRIDASRFVRRVDSMCENLPKQFLYSEMNLLGSHDKPRALTVLAEVGDMEPERRFRHAFDLKPYDYEHGKRRMIAAWKMLCALPGMPCVYYGDEAGLYGMADPYCRGTFPWGKEDRELQKAYSDVIWKRKGSPALRTGSVKLTASGTDVVLITREIAQGKDVFGKKAPNELRVLAVNRAREPRWTEAYGRTVEIPPESAVWIL